MCRRAVRGTSHRLLRITGFQRWGVVVAGNSSLSARYLRIQASSKCSPSSLVICSRAIRLTLAPYSLQGSFD